MCPTERRPKITNLLPHHFLGRAQFLPDDPVRFFFFRVAQRLARIRQKLGISQEQAAACIGVSRSTVCRYEQGLKSVMFLPITARLCKLYGVSLDSVVMRDKLLDDDNLSSPIDPDLTPRLKKPARPRQTRPIKSNTPEENLP